MMTHCFRPHVRQNEEQSEGLRQPMVRGGLLFAMLKAVATCSPENQMSYGSAGSAENRHRFR